MNQQGENMDFDDSVVEDDDWKERKLCRDGNCIGLIGTDGRCNVCGMPDAPDPRETDSSDDPVATDAAGTVPSDPAAPAEVFEVDDTADDVDRYWVDRKLCSDGNCIGVIGPDGKCRECGRTEED